MASPDSALAGADDSFNSEQEDSSQPMSEQTPIGGSSVNVPRGTPPVGSAVHARHGGLITGLAGVLLDGLQAAVTTPDGPNQSSEVASKAMQLPQQRKQAQINIQSQQQMLKVQQAQAHVQQAQTRLLASSLDDEIASGMSDAAWKFATNSVEQGTAKMVSGTGTREAAFSKLKELHDQAPGDIQGNYFAYPAGKAKDGTSEWAVYQTFPSKTLTDDTDFDLPGTKDQGGQVENLHKTFPAGTPMSVYTSTVSQLSRDQAAKIHSETQQKNQTAKDQTQQNIATTRANAQVTKAATPKPPADTSAADRKGAEAEVGKHFKTYSDAERQAKDISSSLDAAQNGNQVAAALAPLESTLFVTSAAGIKRVNHTELDMNMPNAGSIVRAADAWLDKKISGSLPAGYVKDMKALVNLYRQSNESDYRSNVDSVNTRYNTKIPYGIPQTRESVAAQRNKAAFDPSKLPDAQ